MRRLLLVVLFWSFLASAQVVGPGFVDYVTSAPSGSCSQGSHQQNVLGLGTIYTCQSGTWAQVTGGGGSCAQGTCVVNAPTADQTITGAHSLILSDSASGLTDRGTFFVGPAAASYNAFYFPLAGFADWRSIIGGISATQKGAVEVVNQVSGAQATAMGITVANVSSSPASGAIGLDIFAGSNAPSMSAYITSLSTFSEWDGAGNTPELTGVDVFGNSLSPGTATLNTGIHLHSQAGVSATRNAAVYIDDQGTGANDYAVYIAGGKSNLGPQTSTVGNLIDSGLSASLVVCSDGSKQLTTTGCIAPAAPVPTPGTSITLAAPRGYAICTGTCTVSVPVPAAGYEFCILNDDNVSTAITLSALGSSAMYENTARTAYGTAGTGTLVATAVVGNKICLVGRDSTHYLTVSFVGAWTAN